MTTSLPIIDKLNVGVGMGIALLSYFFGEHWILFAGFLALNVMDFITRGIAARITKTTNSEEGLIGIVKKFGYWMMILLAYIMSAIFMEIGETFGINLQISEFIGLAVLAALIVNEVRSILENLVDAGYNPPKILIKGLEAADKAVEKLSDEDSEETKNDNKERDGS